MKAKIMGSRSLRTVWAVLAVCGFGGSDWRHFRGTDNTSVSEEKGLPVSFSQHQNVAWRAELPGGGPSSPIVVAGRVIVTAASGPRQERLHVVCLDAATGGPCWQRRLWATGHTIHEPFGGVAAPTPASDGQLVFALFSSNDLACFDLEGNLRWLRGLALESPTTRNDVGMASSPLVVGQTVIVQLENPGKSFILGLDKSTGQTRWQLDRPSEPTWTSPTVVPGEGPGEPLAIIQSRWGFSLLEPGTGKVLLQHEAPCSTLSSPAVAGNRIFLPARGLTALELDPARRAVKTLWEQARLRCENVSPVVHEGHLYSIKDSGILVCGETASGKVLWQLRLRGPIWATPVIANGHLYAVNYDGLVQVVRLGSEPAVVGTGQIDPEVLASPAVAEGAIYFRSRRFVWKIGRGPDRQGSSPPNHPQTSDTRQHERVP
ncbi:MAG: outer membrane protein assembly factor BamB family protein [Thermoguttaceae bacterium]